MIQIKIFYSELAANAWLKNMEGSVKSLRDIEFSIAADDNKIYKSIMIVYDIEAELHGDNI